MKTYRIPNTDLTVSRIAYGCAMLAGWDRRAFGAEDVARAERLIQTAHACGITFFDHADVYGFGEAEALFGAVLKGSPGLRHRLVIQSKCGQVFVPGWARWGDAIRVNLTRDHIVSAAEGSLMRLGTDYLDLLLLHAPSSLVRPEEVAAAFDVLHESGKVRHFGVSNHSLWQIEMLRRVIRRPLVVNQIRLGLSHCDALVDGAEFSVELGRGAAGKQFVGISGSGTFDYCRLNGIQVQAWSPLRGELLAPPGAAGSEAPPIARKLAELANAKRIGPSAAALAWLLHHPAGIVPVIGATRAEHIVENCAADGVSLSDEEWYELLVAAADLKSRTM